jgi:hypothetical protein
MFVTPTGESTSDSPLRGQPDTAGSSKKNNDSGDEDSILRDELRTAPRNAETGSLVVRFSVRPRAGSESRTAVSVPSTDLEPHVNCSTGLSSLRSLWSKSVHARMSSSRQKASLDSSLGELETDTVLVTTSGGVLGALRCMTSRRRPFPRPTKPGACCARCMVLVTLMGTFRVMPCSLLPPLQRLATLQNGSRHRLGVADGVAACVSYFRRLLTRHWRQ